jgi:choice-of-anchor C domain-containing protein
VTPGDTFETPVVTPGRFRSVPAGQMIGPWTVTGRDVDLIGANFWQAADGVQSVDLEGSAVPNFQGGVKRSVDTATLPVPLFTYKLGYCVAGNPDGPPAVKTGQVLVNGAVAQNFSLDATGKSRTNMGYVEKQLSFTPNGPSTTVEFRSTTSPHGYGPVLDKVTLKKCLLGLICGF